MDSETESNKLELGALWITDDEDEESDDQPHFSYTISPTVEGLDAPTSISKVVGWLAPDDATIVKETLFHSRLWNGATIIANYLSSCGQALAKGKTVVEFGAGGALPSLVSLALGAKCCVMTDYPNAHILQNVRRNVEHNFPGELLGDDLASTSKRACVVGHKWGQDMKEVMMSLSRLVGQATPDSSDAEGSDSEVRGGFDIALLGELIWLHDAHTALLSSVYAALKPGGVALVGYNNHVRGCEDDDMHFFKEAEEVFGFKVEELEREVGQHQFSKSEVVIHLYMMTRCGESALSCQPPDESEGASSKPLSANERMNKERTLTVSKAIPYIRQRRFSELVDMLGSAYGHTLPLGKYRTSNRKRLFNLELAIQRALLEGYTPGWCTEIIRRARLVCESGAYDSGFMTLVLRAVGGWARKAPAALAHHEIHALHREIFHPCADPVALEGFVDAFGITLSDVGEEAMQQMAEYVEHWSVTAPEGAVGSAACDALANLIFKGGGRLVGMLLRES